MFTAIRVLLLGILLGAASPRAFAAVSKPVFVYAPGADSGWVGSTSFSFNLSLLFTGRIMYTLDGTPPQNDVKGTTYRYEPGTDIYLSATTTVRAIHVQGSNVSDEASHDFVRAKVPTPTARSGGVTRFSPALACTLSVAPVKNATSLRYALIDPAAGSATPAYGAYSGPIPLSKSQNLRAFATATGYDPSDTLKVSFVLDTVAAPAIAPASGSFSTRTLTVRMHSGTSGANVRYTIERNPPAPEKWTLMTGDSITFQGGADGDSIILQAQAFVNAYRTSKVQTAKYVYLPAVAAPSFNPTSKTFYDTLWVRMTTSTEGATIRYTDNGSTPTAASLDGTGPVLLKKSDTLIAKAFKDKHEASPAAMAAYTMRLSPPTVDKPDGEFTGSLTIRFRKVNPDAQIYYSTDSSLPPPAVMPDGIRYAAQLDSLGTIQGITLQGKGTTLVRAIAVAAGVSSEVATFRYTNTEVIRTHTAPNIDPESRDFFDTLSIRLTTTDPDAEIRYTLSADGRDPSRLDKLADPAKPIRLDSSAVLRCQTYHLSGATGKHLDSSSVREARYTLRPSVPVAIPAYAEPVPPGTIVKLKSRAKGGIIHYATNQNTDLRLSQGYPDSVSITLNASTSIYAMTTLGTDAKRAYSDTLVLRYEVFTSAPSETLAVDGVRPIAGGFTYRNLSGQPILAKAHTAEGMGLSGFADMSLVVSLQAAGAGQGLSVAFAKPSGGSLSVYRYAGGKVEYVSGKDTVVLDRPGEYFTAIDIQPPRISVLEQIPQDKDSTTVVLKVTDNVANPSCTITSPGLKGGSATRKPDTGDAVTIRLKGANGEANALWLRAVARDAYDSTRLPADPNARLLVAQYWSSLVTPVAFTIGQGEGEDLWDLAGLPVGAGTGLTWAKLAGANPGMQACVWGPNGYELLDESAEIGQGMAFWIGSLTEHSNFTVPRLRAGESEADGTYRIRLKPGWNQVTSPSLDRVYWPITPSVSQGGTATLKAPYRYVRDTHGWRQTDTLEPWIGYFVNYYGTVDTVITVYTSAASRPAAKVAAGPAPVGFGLTFAAGGSPSLRLGARGFARDEVGPEDEPQPPAWGRSASAWSQRGAARLLTDHVRYRSGSVARWRVILDPGAVRKASGGAGAASPANGSALKLSEMALPGGYQAWAVSRARGVRFRLEAGADLPLPADGADTLSIYAGPASALEGLGDLMRVPESVAAFAYFLEKSEGRTRLRVELPWAGALSASVFTLSGRSLAEIRKDGLIPGIYRLPLPAHLPSQALVLRLRVTGPDGRKAFTRTFLP